MKNRYWLKVCLLIMTISISSPATIQAQEKKQPDKTQQQPQPQKPGEPGEQEDQGKLTSRVVNVRLPISVMDKDTSRLITDLNKSEFEIYEDKVKQEIISFLPQSNLPLDVAVLMDTSNSVKPKLKFEKSAASSFIETVLQERQDRALFVTFDSAIELHQDFTNQGSLLWRAIEKVKAQGETRLYDGIYRVCEEKMFANPGRRRAMVVISDGEDTASEHSLKEAIDIAQRTETVVFIISTKSGGFFGVEAGTVDRSEDKELKRLAEETGGRAFFTGNVLELEKSFSIIARELRSQYMISYEPVNSNYDGKFRKIEVRLPGHKNLRVRVKDGYTALPDLRAGLKQASGQ